MLALERERQSLTEYALAGLSSHQIVRAKWWALASFALVMVLTPLPVAALCFPLGGVSPIDFWSANILCVGVALASCSMGLAISATHRTVSGVFAEIIKRLFSIACFVAPPLLLISFLAPELMLVVGIGVATTPLFLLPKIEQEMYFVMQHLEVDAPQTPDYTASPDEVPARLKPIAAEWAEGAVQAHEPMSAQELARYMNAAEVERGQIDPPPSRLDLSLENSVAFSPLARRDVRTQLRSWRRQRLVSEPAPIFSWAASLLIGGVLGVVGLADSKPGLSSLMYAIWHVGFLPVAFHIALLSATSFSRERMGNMMVQLRLSALSTAEILGAKLVAPFAMSARMWGFPLLTLTLTALSFDALRVGVEAVLFVLILLLVSLVGMVCSLLFRPIALSTSATLFVLALLFVVCPAVFSPLLFKPPVWLRAYWLVPLQGLFGGAGQTANMLPLLAPLTVFSALLWWACSWLWSKAAS